ncbi:hypothetical protein BpHYR1_036583, partial [Brachionus plicatilis]
MTISMELHAEQSTYPESKCSMKTYAVSNYTLELCSSPSLPRNKYGRGVAILVKEGIEFIQDFSFDEFSSEILSIKLNYGKNDLFYVFSLYNPP